MINLDDAVTEAEKRVLAEKKAIDRYLLARSDLARSKGRLGKLGFITKFPYPNQLFSAVLALFGVLAFVHFLPVIWDWVMFNWLKDGVTGKDLFLVSLAFNAVLIMLLSIIMLFARGPVKTFIKSGILKRPILQLYTKNRTSEFIIPKEVDMDIWTITDTTAIIPDPEAIVIGPHNRPMMLGVPELGVGFNPRLLIAGKDSNIDMTIIKQYGHKHEQKMYQAMKTGADVIKPFIMPLILIVIMGLILGPFFYQKMGDMDEGKKWRSQYENCRVEMLDAGVTPKDLEKAEEEAVDESKVEAASTGMEVK